MSGNKERIRKITCNCKITDFHNSYWRLNQPNRAQLGKPSTIGWYLHDDYIAQNTGFVFLTNIYFATLFDNTDVGDLYRVPEISCGNCNKVYYDGEIFENVLRAVEYKLRTDGYQLQGETEVWHYEWK